MILPSRYSNLGSPNPAYFNMIYHLLGMDKTVVEGDVATADDTNIIFEKLGSSYRVYDMESMDPGFDKLEQLLREKYDFA